MESIKKEIRLSKPEIYKSTDKRLPEIVIYSEENFAGIEYRTNCNIDFVGKLFNDAVKSIVVVSGVWEIYQHKDFRNLLITLESGYFSTTIEIDPESKGISSAKCQIK